MCGVECRGRLAGAVHLQNSRLFLVCTKANCRPSLGSSTTPIRLATIRYIRQRMKEEGAEQLPS